MVSLGEMVAHLPVAGGHITLARRFVTPALGFAMGWNYWVRLDEACSRDTDFDTLARVQYNWVIVLPAELNAAAVLISYWSSANPAIWITVCLVVAVLINLGGARAYGEAEFWFAIIKVRQEPAD